MQKDDEHIKALLEQWRVPEPRSDLAERIIASAMAAAPETVVPASRFGAWMERFNHGYAWKTAAAALAFAMLGSFALVGQEVANAPLTVADASLDSMDATLFAEVHFENEEEWSEESLYSFL